MFDAPALVDDGNALLPDWLAVHGQGCGLHRRCNVFSIRLNDNGYWTVLQQKGYDAEGGTTLG
jgi:hypothetical protein